MSSRPRYATVVLDVDSTVAGIEGIDWLAALRAPDVAAHSEELTRQVMEGAVALEKVYGDRMRLIAPTAEEINRLGSAYVAAIAPGCIDAVRQLRAAVARPRPHARDAGRSRKTAGKRYRACGSERQGF